jgi:hypothetical protein
MSHSLSVLRERGRTTGNPLYEELVCVLVVSWDRLKDHDCSCFAASLSFSASATAP